MRNPIVGGQYANDAYTVNRSERAAKHDGAVMLSLNVFANCCQAQTSRAAEAEFKLTTLLHSACNTGIFQTDSLVLGINKIRLQGTSTGGQF